MLDKLLLPIGISLDVVPYAFLCYSPFMDNLRISKKKLLVILSFISIVQFIVYYCYYTVPYALVQLTFFASLVFYFILYFCTIKMNFSKQLFVFLFITNYAGIVVGISNSLEACFFSKYPSIGGYNLPLILINLAVLIITLPVFLHSLNSKIKPLLNLTNTKTWDILWMIPLMFLLGLIVFAGADYDNLIESWQYAAITVITTIVVHVVYYVVIKMIFQMDENVTLKENVRMVNMQLALQEDSYKNLSEHITKTRAARHDLRHHLSVIEASLQSGEKEFLTNYLKEYKSSLPDDTELEVCKNYAVNVIVRHYTGLAKEEGISVSVNLQLPQKIGIADLDLCIVFGNCLENALEACRRMNDGQKFIRVKSGIHGNILGITIDNSFDGTVEEKSGTFFSRKRNHEEGVGLSCVRAVTNKYNGNSLFTFDDKEFQASIMLNTKK